MLVVHDYVMSRRVPGLHVSQLALFMHVNQRVPSDRFIKPRVVHFARLEHDIAVSKKDGGSPFLDVRDNVE